MKKMGGGLKRELIRDFCLLALTILFSLASQAVAAQEVSVLHSFTGLNDGAYPDGILATDSAGNFYGTTQIGGAYGAGTVFELSPEPSGKWRFSLLYTFTGGADGASPLGSLVFDAAGNGYATVSGGGANGLGAVFELSPPAHGAGKHGQKKFCTALPEARTARFRLAMWCSMRRGICSERRRLAERLTSDVLRQRGAARFMSCRRRAGVGGTSA